MCKIYTRNSSNLSSPLLTSRQSSIYLSIYIKKKVCVFVCYLCIGPCKSERHQTFHGTPLGPEEGREGVSATNEDGGWAKFHPDHDKLQFSPIFQKFREFATILRRSISYCHIFALIVSMRYGSGHLSM